MPYIVIVTYNFPAGSEDNVFGTFRTDKAAQRFAGTVRAWDDARPDTDRKEVRQVTTRVEPVTKQMLEFVQADVARYDEVTIISAGRPAGGKGR